LACKVHTLFKADTDVSERLKKIFLVCPIWLPIFFFFFQLLNEPGLGAGIYPGMALTELDEI